MYKKILIVLSAGAALTACTLDPKAYETTPVVVDTAAGPVTCQLYTKELVRWDRSVDRPAGMSVETADKVCLAEGQREKAEMGM